jgi:hypothetical protein
MSCLCPADFFPALQIMEYCTIQEAWGITATGGGKKRKGKKTPKVPVPATAEEEEEEEANMDMERVRYSRDIQRLPDHNGPESRENVRPMEIDEDMISSYAPTNYQILTNDEVIPQKPTGNEDWLESRFSQINVKLQQLYDRLNKTTTTAGGRTQSGSSGDGSMADTFLFVSTGVLTIFVLDLFFKTGMKLK